MMLNLEIFPNDRIQMLADELATMLKQSLSKTDGSEIDIKMMYDHIPDVTLDSGKVIEYKGCYQGLYEYNTEGSVVI